MRGSRTKSARFACVAALGLAGLAGCRTASPPADRIVYDVREMPYVLAYDASGVTGPVGAAASGRPVEVFQDEAGEARRRAWVEEHYGRPARVVERPADDRYVPQVERVRERVIVVEREPSSRVWLPPLAVGLGVGYLAGRSWRGHHHSDWGWHAGWGYPLWCW